MPEKYVKVRALKSFIGAGVSPSRGDVVEMTEYWAKKYERRGYVTRTVNDGTYQTKVVEPERGGGLSGQVPVRPEPVPQPEPSVVSVDDLRRAGPYYVLPDGRNVLGRENAEAELAKYESEHESDS